MVIAIFPSLASRHSRCLWSVRIGDVVTIHFASITWYSFLTYSISDFLACCVLRQSLGLILPVVSGSHILLIHNRITIQNFNLNRSWTLTILVFRIIPFLLTRNLDRFWGVRVGDVVAVHLARVARYSFFCNSISNFLACCILRKRIRFIFPTVSSRHFLHIDNILTFQDLDSNSIWTLAILVFRIIPLLLTGNLDCFWFVSVGHYKAVSSIASYLRLIVRNRVFFQRINNFLSLFIFVQVGELGCPLVSFGQSSVRNF